MNTHDFIQKISESSIVDHIMNIWNLTLVSVSGRVIQLSNIIVAILILLCGIYLAKLFSKMLEKHLFKKFNLTIATASTARLIANYFFIIFFIFLALHFANIPLTIFTFLGGAIALGVGFGSQNIINNFISGLIVLFERPIKVGDFVDIDNILGKVEHIGARSTRLLRSDNTHMIIPNSWLLEKKVLNWNYSDQRVRTSVKVGVAYHSNVTSVIHLLKKATSTITTILKTPAPTILFDDFGDNALQFEIIFWVEVENLLQRRMIESGLREKISELFRADHITIAFPQRDVHLFSSEPIPVYIQKESKKSETS